MVKSVCVHDVAFLAHGAFYIVFSLFWWGQHMTSPIASGRPPTPPFGLKNQRPDTANQLALQASVLKNSLDMLGEVSGCCKRNGEVRLRARCRVLGAWSILHSFFTSLTSWWGRHVTSPIASRPAGRPPTPPSGLKNQRPDTANQLALQASDLKNSLDMLGGVSGRCERNEIGRAH